MLSLLSGPAITSVYSYWKSHSLTIRTFVSKVVSLLFNMLSRFVIALLSRTKRLLVLWLWSPSAVFSQLWDSAGPETLPATPHCLEFHLMFWAWNRCRSITLDACNHSGLVLQLNLQLILVSFSSDLFGLPSWHLVVKNPPANTGDGKRGGFDPWVRKIPWRRA